MAQYSYKRALGWSAGGMAVAGLAGTFQAVAHHAAQHFDTLGASFAYVAQPANILAAAGLSLLFGAAMEYRRWYHANLDEELAKKAKPVRPNPSRKP